MSRWFMPYIATALVMAAWAHASPAKAQSEGPSFDCTKASGSVEELICTDTELAVLDRRMAQTFAAALSSAQQIDVGSEEALAELRAIQRGWIKGRNDCWKASEVKQCVSDSYLIREGELVAMWILQKPKAVVRYICDKTPANEVYVIYFDTELPSIRLEYGDTIRTGSLTMSASGAKYATGFGGFFWDNGDTALFAVNEGTERQCEKPN